MGGLKQAVKLARSVERYEMRKQQSLRGCRDKSMKQNSRFEKPQFTAIYTFCQHQRRRQIGLLRKAKNRRGRKRK